MKRWIVVRFEGSGFHRWKDAPGRYAYLRSLHHHIFRVTCRIEVEHRNRALEFIDAADLLRRWFQAELDDNADFLNMSCETMAEQVWLLVRATWTQQATGLIEVEVTEDGIHGGGYAKPATTS